MPPRKKGAQVKNSTTGRGHGRGHGRGRGAAAQEAHEEPAPVVEDAPAPSESEAESIAPSPASQMDIVAEVYQPSGQSSSDSDEELPPSEAAKSQKKRKRQLVTADFTEEQEQEMVDWLKAPEQDCLLNKKHPNYIKKGLKDALWEQKAREMGKTSAQLKKWYANMRSRFGKLKQTPSGSGKTELTARDRWILRHFEFLRLHLIVQVKKRVTVSVSILFHNFHLFMLMSSDEIATIVHMFSHVFTVLMIVSSPDEGQGPSQGSSGCSSRSSPV